jgi:hypothetical protein
VFLRDMKEGAYGFPLYAPQTLEQACSTDGEKERRSDETKAVLCGMSGTHDAARESY